jgi:Sigma-70, region 4.
MRRTEHRLGRPLADELRDRYETRGETMAEIAQALGVSEATISRWMVRLGIEARFPGRRSEAIA